MMRKDVDPALISQNDTNAKVLVWVDRPDGSRELCGLKRVAIEHRINQETFSKRWRMAGSPDVIPAELLAPAGDTRFKNRPKEPVAQPVKRTVFKIRLMPDNELYRAADLARMFDVPASSLSAKKLRGMEEITREELAAMQRQPLRRHQGNYNEPPRPAVPRNIDDVEYQPTAYERSLLGCR